MLRSDTRYGHASSISESCKFAFANHTICHALCIEADDSMSFGCRD